MLNMHRPLLFYEHHKLQTMRKTLLIHILLAAVTMAYAMMPVKWNARYQAYIDRYHDIAIYEMLQHNIPASITLAQGLLESAAGESDLCRKGNNHFGIKCHDWTGPTMHHDDDAQGECFRVYDSAWQSFEDHSRFLERDRYKRLFSLRRDDYAAWARGLKECGYATNPRYAQLLIDIIRCYNLSDYDHATTYNAENIGQGVSRGRGDIAQTSVRHHAAPTNWVHDVKVNNKKRYFIARRGDTLSSIAAETGVSAKRLAKYNERYIADDLREGDIIYLQKKRSKAARAYKNVPHVVTRGQSMYDIAQMYGIRLKSLYKKNGFSPDHAIKVGDRVRVY